MRRFAELLAIVLLLAGPAVPASADWCALSFAQEVLVHVGASPGETASGDFNHDGRTDLAVVNRVQNGTVAILLGQPGGTFAAPSYVSLGAAGRGPIAALKLDGDAHLDLVTIAGEYLQVLLGNGQGGFTAGDMEHVGISPGDLAASDFDNDGDIDFAVSRSGSYPSGVQIYLNFGGGNLSHKTLVEVHDTFIVSVAAGDFDGDGNNDLALTDQSRKRVQVVFGAGNGGFFTTGHYIDTAADPIFEPHRLATGDFNRDGFDDLAAGNRDPYGNGGVTFAVALSNGAGRTFVPAVEYGDLDANGAYDLLVRDIDGDGKLDTVVGSTTTHIFRGRGDGTFYRLMELYDTYFHGSMAIVDVDSDGGPDILAAVPGSNIVRIARNFCGAAALTLTSSANPATHGSAFTLTANLTSNPATATGTLTLRQTGDGTIGTVDVNGPTTLSVNVSRGAGTYEFVADYSGDDRFVIASKTLVLTVQPAPFGPPPGFGASSSGGAPQLTWHPTAGTAHYEVFRNTGGGYVSIGTTTSTSYHDLTAPAETAMLYKVRAVSSGGTVSAFSAHDFTTTHLYTDPALAAGMIARRAHLTELRGAVDAVRVLAGLSPGAWTDAVPVVIKAAHMTELRTAINEARAAHGLTASAFDESPLIKAQHVNEARAALR